MSAVLLVSAGGFIGANLRFAISLWAARRFGAGFPVGTMIANLGGSLLLGLVLGLLAGWVSDDEQIRLLLATGLLGAETTFSTYSLETVTLLRLGRIRRAAVSFLGGAGLGLLAVTLGLVLAYLITDVA
jgi:fluoride exporter